jgi:hypothetical protein
MDSGYQQAGLLARPVEDDANLLECDEPTADHFVELKQNLLDSLREFDNLDHDGQVLRKPQDFVRVVDARRSVATRAAEHVTPLNFSRRKSSTIAS